LCFDTVGCSPESALVSSSIVISLSLTKYHLCKSCYYHIRELHCIRQYLDLTTASTIATSTVHSKLDNCNSMYKTTTFQNLKQIVFRLFRTLLPGLLLRLPDSVTSHLPSNLYIGLKLANALNINFFLLPIKLLPLLKLLICTA